MNEIIGTTTAETKVRKTNRGLQIRQAKLNKKSKIRKTVKDSQENLCQFVIFKNPIISRNNPRHKFAFQGFDTIKGLQIENKVFYIQNYKLRYVFVNKHRARVIERYNSTPEWANEMLIKKQHEFLSK